MQICCILPYSESRFRDYFVKDAILKTGLYEIASKLKKIGHDIIILDYLSKERADADGLNEKLNSFNPDILIVNASVCFEDYLWFIGKLSNKYKEKVHILIGTGAVSYEYAFQHSTFVDYIIPVYPEVVISSLIQIIINHDDIKAVPGVAYKKNDAIFYNKFNNINSTDLFPQIDISDCISREDQSKAYLWASKGCWYKECTYCTVGGACKSTTFWVPRSIDDVTQYIESLHSRGVRHIFFLDAQFIGPGEKGKLRAEKISNYIKSLYPRMTFSIQIRIDSFDKILFSKLIEAGLDTVFVGIESCSDDILYSFKKGYDFNSFEKNWKILMESEIKVIPGLLLAEPFATVESLHDHLLGLKRMYLGNSGKIYLDSLFHEVHLHAGTKLYDDVMRVNELFCSEAECVYFDCKTAKAVRLIRYLFEKLHDYQKKIYAFGNIKLYEYIICIIKRRIIDVMISIVEDVINGMEEEKIEIKIEYFFKELHDKLKR